MRCWACLACFCCTKRLLTELLLLTPCRAILLECLKRLLIRCLISSYLYVLQLFAKVTLTLCLHDSLSVSTKTACLRCLLLNLTTHNIRLLFRLSLLYVSYQLLVWIHILLQCFCISRSSRSVLAF
jgi:hypothetical protein